MDSILRHVGTSLTIWIGTEIKYQEWNWHDLLLFLLCGAVVPTVAEFLKQGLPPEETVVVTVPVGKVEFAKEESGEKKV